ncbi:hypothetical protein KFL_010090010, partial [Klebsormidium nitens]
DDDDDLDIMSLKHWKVEELEAILQEGAQQNEMPAEDGAEQEEVSGGDGTMRPGTGVDMFDLLAAVQPHPSLVAEMEDITLEPPTQAQMDELQALTQGLAHQDRMRAQDGAQEEEVEQPRRKSICHKELRSASKALGDKGRPVAGAAVLAGSPAAAGGTGKEKAQGGASSKAAVGKHATTAAEKKRSGVKGANLKAAASGKGKAPDSQTTQAGKGSKRKAPEGAASGNPQPEKKTRRYRPGTLALREIRKYQKSTDPLIPRLSFARLVRELCDAETARRPGTDEDGKFRYAIPPGLECLSVDTA